MVTEATPIHTQGAAGGRYCVLVHGGAGNVPLERRALHVEGCLRAARVAAELLGAGGSALDAVERAVRALEDDPLFNAGTGASLNEEGRVEHDASIMEGRTLRAGGVCALSGFRNPVAIARAVLEDGRHVLYAAGGAARFALARGFTSVDEASLVTEAARAALHVAQSGQGPTGWAGGTVGAVAFDATGLRAAATSTGGTLNKRVGRVGDSPLIGAGTYADDEAGAVSTTGHGEAMIRLGVARAVAEHMRAGASPEEAARVEIARTRDRLQATGGVIALDATGRWGLARSTDTMSWAVAGERGELSGY
ncbi:isoaspartyl peptidase/L-asparaginase [Chondromyces apiculatus]|uniref:Isoaspartyl peptidase n=1 Tax=Chondromyces apiculatus DSM 436 TaxID=1192034 RepID=A0A017TE65_9BACT|nr:isoaspartyl peptidase/L-asparaginase [Chondromyces apiculatus]EYF07558.1 L-asparaginase [Chondromyces apiculatus DSM 436]